LKKRSLASGGATVDPLEPLGIREFSEPETGHQKGAKQPVNN
jgi:hypothetical protein